MKTDADELRLEAGQIDDAVVERFDLINRYVSGQLAPELAEAFEEYYLDRPELVAEIRLEKALREGLKHEGDALGSAAPAPANPLWLPLAAGLLVTLSAVVSVWSYAQQRAARSDASAFAAALRDAQAPMVSLSPTLIGQTRGVVRTIGLPAPGKVRPVVFQVASADDYAVDIVDATGAVVWSARELYPDAAGRLQVLLTADARLLPDKAAEKGSHY
ncbi:MAG: hypothetical protein AAGD86_14055 [Pseudomonadota bacterium]